MLFFVVSDEVYEILYEDDRDVDVDKLTDAEVCVSLVFQYFFVLR